MIYSPTKLIKPNLLHVFQHVTPLNFRDNWTGWQRVVAGKSTAMWEPGRLRLQEGKGKNEEKD